MLELEREFTIACQSAIAECRSIGYNPSVWARMVDESGGKATAKKLIRSGDFQSGLLKLLSLGRIDLTVEQAVLDDRWSDLFTDEERELARWRLTEAQRGR